MKNKFKISKNIEIVIKGNSITSKGLREPCPFCDKEECDMSCEDSMGLVKQDDIAERDIHNARIDTLESFLLALSESCDLSKPGLHKVVTKALNITLDELIIK